jgi:hypothetical protein
MVCSSPSPDQDRVLDPDRHFRHSLPNPVFHALLLGWHGTSGLSPGGVDDGENELPDRAGQSHVHSLDQPGFPTEVEPESIQISNLDRTDARFWMLENYPTTLIGAEILTEAPTCLGAYIADMKDYPGPYAILIVDRNSGDTIFRIALLKDYLTR